MEVTSLASVLEDADKSLAHEWVTLQRRLPEIRLELISEQQMKAEASTFLKELRAAVIASREVSTDDLMVDGPEWADMRSTLGDLTRDRTRAGWEPHEVALFLLSLKKPLIDRLRSLPGSGAHLGAVWRIIRIVDQLSVYSTNVLIQAREEIIIQQREEMLELSTPVVELWKGVLGLPLIGTLDSYRTQQAMEVLLGEIVKQEASIAILDITGVPTVDSATAQHLLRATRAANLMGAECIISGVRPQIAQTMVTLGIELDGIATRSSMSSALALALQRLGLQVDRVK